MSVPAREILAQAASALGLAPRALERVTFAGVGELPSAFAVTDFATATMGAAALALRELLRVGSDHTPALRLDRRLASLWFGRSIQPQGWEMPGVWDAIAGDYPTADGWIRLHTNAPHHRQAALAALQCADDRASVTAAVSRWTAQALETAVVEQGGCAAEMRSMQAWRTHPQGAAVASEPLVAWTTAPGTVAPSLAWRPTPDRPLAGLKVLDLTRVLAGPTATRFLAGYGAQVLRIDPPTWDEQAIVPDVTPGKRCARLDLEKAPDRAIFEGLLCEADILVHGYRPGALAALGYAKAARRRMNPGLIEVTLDAYGWTGPWSQRRGFDSLVQMSSGIAHRGQAWKSASKPVPLPVQALDHATGYLMAAAAVRALVSRLVDGQAAAARLSLARTGWFLANQPREDGSGEDVLLVDDDLSTDTEATDWGPARRLHGAVEIAGVAQRWDRPATRLGSAAPRWI